MSLSLEDSQIYLNNSRSNALEMRLLRISEEYNSKYIEQSSKISCLSREMQAALETKRNELGENPSSEDYRQNLSACESIENEYNLMINEIRDQMEIAEERLDIQKEQIETQKEYIEANEQTWKDARDDTTESFGYFQSR